MNPKDHPVLCLINRYQTAHRNGYVDADYPPRRNTKNAWRRVEIIAHRFGLKVIQMPQNQSAEYQYPADGRVIVSTPADALHEVAHFQVASPGRRKLPDYGLGRAPQSRLEVKPRISDPIREEARVSLLGMVWEWHVGLDFHRTAFIHGWHNNDGPSAINVMRSLLRSGYVSKDGCPTLHRRSV